ncbi:hypothetical protein ABZ743_32760 [Streptomyces sp. NPDC006662]|uniref:hypothetical protein n=1 Tax=Streptomyces sp. NPDC006662 TaxID=3156902 RepID=UPI0033E2C8AA
MQARRSLRRRSTRPDPVVPSCGTSALLGGLRVLVVLVVVVVVAVLVKSGFSVLDAFGLVTVAAGTAAQITS